MTVLVSLSYSPWSEKARWALDHHGIAYRQVEYLPMLGAPLLHVAVRDLRGRVTVPVLFVGRDVYRDSFLIATYAERRGAGGALLPPALLEPIRRWNAVSEELLSAGRALAVAATLKDRDALTEGLPGFIPPAARRGLLPLAFLGAHYLVRKYGLQERHLEAHRRVMYASLDRLREALTAHGGTVLPRFTYADVAMATALQFVAPVSGRHIPLGPATRLAWTRPRLAEDYADLLSWRDRTFDRHRRTPR